MQDLESLSPTEEQVTSEHHVQEQPRVPGMTGGERSKHGPPWRGPRRGIVIAALVGATVLLAATPVVAFYQGRHETQMRHPTQSPALTTFRQSARPVAHPPLVRMIKTTLPSVVNIETEAVGTTPLEGPGRLRGEGSGVVIDKDGAILTNNHVVAGAYKVTVLFNDGKHHAVPGTVVGTDPDHDIAVIHVDAHNLTPMKIARSSELRLGDEAVALGFPLNLGGPTVTRGIVSGLDRTIDVQGSSREAEHLVGVIQTDAAINPGNSGGPLVDSAGRLVGINTAAASAAAAENVGFAIPIDEALPVAKGILSHPMQKQPWLGVRTVTLAPFAALQLGLSSDTRGAAVVEVIPKSPAAHAGLRPGEVITAIGARTVASSADLTAAVAHHRPGESILVHVVVRSGEKSIEVQLASRPATFAVPKR